MFNCDFYYFIYKISLQYLNILFKLKKEQLKPNDSFFLYLSKAQLFYKRRSEARLYRRIFEIGQR